MLLVTGITGHSGRYFLQELIDHKYEGAIRCVVRSSSVTSFLKNNGLKVEKVIGDLSDQKFLDNCMEDVDTVMHIGSIFFSVPVVAAAVNNMVKRAILVHTTGIYSKYKSASEEYKSIELEIEKIAAAASIGITILRPTMIYGNLNDQNMIVFIKLVNKFRLFPIIDGGKSLIQPVNGRDLGKAYYQILSTPEIVNGDYILSGNKPIKMLDMFKMIGNMLGKKTFFISVPLGVGVFFARCLKLCTLGAVDLVEKVQRMGEDRNYSYEKAYIDFGYNPMPFEKGLKMEIEEYRKQSK